VGANWFNVVSLMEGQNERGSTKISLLAGGTRHDIGSEARHRKAKGRANGGREADLTNVGVANQGAFSIRNRNHAQRRRPFSGSGRQIVSPDVLTSS
jgi:hypothetical protein